jgi:hypothetical protein
MEHLLLVRPEDQSLGRDSGRRGPSKSQAETTSKPTASSQICLLAYNFTNGGVTPIGHRCQDLRYGIVTYLLTSRGYVRYENLPARSQIAELAVKDEIAICLVSFSPLWRKAGEIALWYNTRVFYLATCSLGVLIF